MFGICFTRGDELCILVKCSPFFAGRDFWSWRCIVEASAFQPSTRHVTILLEAICQSKLIGCLSSVALWRLLYWGRSFPLLTLRLGFYNPVLKKYMYSYWRTKGSAGSKPFFSSALVEFAVTEQLRAFYCK